MLRSERKGAIHDAAPAFDKLPPQDHALALVAGDPGLSIRSDASAESNLSGQNSVTLFVTAHCASNHTAADAYIWMAPYRTSIRGEVRLGMGTIIAFCLCKLRTVIARI